jgi:hypothetical protein
MRTLFGEAELGGMCTIKLSAVPVRRTSNFEGTRDMSVPDNDIDNVRIDVLRRLAEQAMTDLDFRAIARNDLDAALVQFGYDLTEAEMTIVHKFRAVLEEAGLDLFLTGEFDDQLGDLVAMAGIDPGSLR